MNEEDIMRVITLALLFALGPQTQITPRDAARSKAAMGTAAIRGRVVAADTGAPMRRAVVTLMPMQPTQPMPSRNISTDGEGRFEFKSLPAGSYRLRVMPPPNRSQYLASTYGGRRPNDTGRAIELVAGQQFEQADIPMPRGGAIPGRRT